MKRTRKSLFISTILMVVLLIVAISTATFAWYSSQNQAKAENAKLSTASTTDANIGIYFGDDQPASSVEFGAMGGLHPMVPTTDPAEADYDALTFNEGVVSLNEHGQKVFKQVNLVTPWKQMSTGESPSSLLKIENLDPDASRKVKITTTITPGSVTATFEDGAPSAGDNNILEEAADALRVAIYVVLPGAGGVGDPQYLGTYGKGVAKYGTPVAAELAADFGTVFTTNDGTFATFDAVGGGSPVVLHIYAWLEGPIIEANHSLVSVTFSLTFAAGNPVPVSVQGD